MSQNPSPTEQARLDEIVARSAVDPEFRQRLLDAPDAAVEEVLGVDVSSLPESFRIRFVEKDPGTDVLIVLPDLQAPEGELSDAELEAVAGGADDCWWTCVCSKTEVSTGAQVAS